MRLLAAPPAVRRTGGGLRHPAVAARYRLLHVIDDPGYGDMWIIFGRPWDGKADRLPEDTALRRLFKERLRAGGSVGRGYGLYLRNT